MTGRDKKKNREIAAPPWLVTFADMTTLLLAFFIILLSVARIDGQELKIILSEFPGLDRLLTGTTLIDGPLSTQSVAYVSAISDTVESSFDTVTEKFSKLFEFELEGNVVELSSNEKGLVISLATDFFFKRNSAEVDLASVGDNLRKVSLLLRDYVNIDGGQYRVEGHSDEEDIPLGLGFDSLWDLSTARAISIIELLEKFLVPTENAHVAGYGNTRPYVSKTQDSPFNRRVDIIILNDGTL